MALYVYVDNSNYFVEARRLSAVVKGIAGSMRDAQRNSVVDPTYLVDYGKLYEFVAGGPAVGDCHARLYGSRPPESDTVWNLARNAGFEVIVEDRNVANKEKKIDAAIITQMMADSYERIDSAVDTMILVAGDGDFEPTILNLIRRGFTVKVVFWGQVSRDLEAACSEFINLDGHLKHLESPAHG